ncbi:sensor histidine kinase [Zavarzinia compransoris]|uniref:sensor histidine kinase n=1 Tax=Zavarzinia compransoris TaxID=1264899 RepID=UPI0010D07169|nr:HAMP domain-containing sensor histidine kinase [Zavarzinia compransoris]TDP46398.1 signal transduction histidine kinase [Zavarzinia compransoris]
MTLRLGAAGAWWARSIRWKLAGIFVAICLVPMLIVTDFTSHVVVRNFRTDVETWLFQISRFFAADILDERLETAQTANALVEEGVLIPLITGETHDLPPLVQRMIDTLGYDILAIFDDQDEVVFSTGPQAAFTSISFVAGQAIYLYHQGQRPILMAAGSRHLQLGGRAYTVLLGTLIDQSFISNMGAMSSLMIRVYYNLDGDFVEVYSSQATPDGQARLPLAVTESLTGGQAGNGYVSADTTGSAQSIGIYTPFVANGKLIGILYCGLNSNAGLAGWVTRWNLFIGIFALGMALSIGAGLIMSRLLVRPVTRLAAGVNAIAEGDFSERVPVVGHDELAQLAVAFNSMARQLEGLRKREAKLRRRERMITLGEVAAGLAHEVRNPLGIIKTSAELLEASASLTEVERRRIGYVVDEVRRIDRLIRDFLAFARPPQRQVEIAVHDLVTHVLGICQSEIERLGVAVQVLDHSGGAKACVDFDQMIQAGLNLVLNALQAMAGEPGKAAPAGPPPRLSIDIAAEDDEVHLRIADNGPGIPDPLLARIFDPFVTTKSGGTGLGLAKVFAVAEGHGGWVEARNHLDGGAIFEFVVPRSDRRQGNAPHDPDR